MGLFSITPWVWVVLVGCFVVALGPRLWRQRQRQRRQERLR